MNQEHIELIQVQLNSFYNQSQSNANGWSVIQYGRIDLNSDNNVYRSVLPAYQDSSNYWNTMESIFNDSSSYASTWSQNSIFNTSSNYGNSYSSLSVFNDGASNPPMIIGSNGLVGYLSVGPSWDSDRYSPYDIKYTCDWD